MPRERPKRCFSWPEEALLTNDEDFIYLPWQQGLRGWRLNCGKTLQNAAGEKEITTVLLPLVKLRQKYEFGSILNTLESRWPFSIQFSHPDENG